MKVKDAMKEVRRLGFKVRREEGEFCLMIPGVPEADYFTDDVEDLVATAWALKERGEI